MLSNLDELHVRVCWADFVQRHVEVIFGDPAVWTPWPAFNRGGANKEEPSSILGAEREELASNKEIFSIWRQAWEKCFAQLPQAIDQC